jgi:hypothetical protein
MIDSDKISIELSNDNEFKVKSKVTFMENGSDRLYFIDVNDNCYLVRLTPLNVNIWNCVENGDIIHFVEYDGKFPVMKSKRDKYLIDIKLKR